MSDTGTTAREIVFDLANALHGTQGAYGLVWQLQEFSKDADEDSVRRFVELMRCAILSEENLL